MIEILTMLGLTILQNASFTLVSRARNSNSIMYHTIASVLSNGIWLLVIRQVVSNFDNWILMVTYLIGSVIGSISMHYVAMKYFENNKTNNMKNIFLRIYYNYKIKSLKKDIKSAGMCLYYPERFTGKECIEYTEYCSILIKKYEDKIKLL